MLETEHFYGTLKLIQTSFKAYTNKVILCHNFQIFKIQFENSYTRNPIPQSLFVVVAYVVDEASC